MSIFQLLNDGMMSDTFAMECLSARILHLQVKVKVGQLLRILLRLNTPGWLWKGQQCCSCCYYSSPVCIHSRLSASPPLKKTPVEGRDGKKLSHSSALLQKKSQSFVFCFRHLCRMLSLGPHVRLVIFVVSEAHLHMADSECIKLQEKREEGAGETYLVYGNPVPGAALVV